MRQGGSPSNATGQNHTALRYTTVSDAGDDLDCLFFQNLVIYRDFTKELQP